MNAKLLSSIATLVAILPSLSPTCKADPIPPAFGVLSAYNLVALGTVDAHGNTVIAGTISTSSDVTGRIAAADMVLTGTTVASDLNKGHDPYGSLTPYVVVSTNGFNGNPTFNINNNGASGSVFAPGSNGTLNFNPGGSGTRVTSGSSGIDFNALRSTLDAQSVYLGSLAANGQNLGTGNNGYGNPSNFVLLGTNAPVNVFNITPDELASVNHPLNIVNVPSGSTIIINVIGTSATGYAFTAGASILVNGQPNYVPNNYNNSKILINFPNATSINVTGDQFDASLLAPFAILNSSHDLDGNIIAAQIGSTGEVHNLEFDGSLPTPPQNSIPPVPEPGTLALVGTGVLSIAGAVRRKAKGLAS